MDSYLTAQRSTIFQHVAVLIYVFEVGARDAPKDAEYYRDCLDALQKYSPETAVFLLVHKMDLVTGDKRAVLERRTRELQTESGTVPVTVFGTSIYDETLYKVRPDFLYACPPLTKAGMVAHRAHHHPKRGRPFETFDNPRSGLQCY
jgi:Ras-related GTP-binding protein A/B